MGSWFDAARGYASAGIDTAERAKKVYGFVTFAIFVLALTAYGVVAQAKGTAWGVAAMLGVITLWSLVTGIRLQKELHDRPRLVIEDAYGDRGFDPTQVIDTPEGLPDELKQKVPGVVHELVKVKVRNIGAATAQNCAVVLTDSEPRLPHYLFVEPYSLRWREPGGVERCDLPPRSPSNAIFDVTEIAAGRQVTRQSATWDDPVEVTIRAHADAPAVSTERRARVWRDGEGVHVDLL